MKTNSDKSKEMLISFMQYREFRNTVPRLIIDGIEIDNVQYAKLLGVNISSDLTWDKHVENIVAKAGKRVYMLYKLKRAGIGQHDSMTSYICQRVCPVWHTNLNRHLTESIETVQKRALKCIDPGNEYADILCLTNLQCLTERRVPTTRNPYEYILQLTNTVGDCTTGSNLCQNDTLHVRIVILTKRYIIYMCNVAYHVASHFYCLAFYMLVCTLYT